MHKYTKYIISLVVQNVFMNFEGQMPNPKKKQNNKHHHQHLQVKSKQSNPTCAANKSAFKVKDRWIKIDVDLEP